MKSDVSPKLFSKRSGTNERMVRRILDSFPSDFSLPIEACSRWGVAAV